MLHVFSDDEEYVVAANEADARAVMQETCGPDVWTSDVEIQQMPDSKRFAIMDEGQPEVRKTFGEWAATHGRGYLCASSSLGL